MYLRFKRIIIFCFFLLTVIEVAAQSQYSVNATLVVQPPYSTHISDYTSQPGKILSTLLNISPTGGTVKVYLLGSISSSGGISIVTDPSYKMPEPITLTMGQPYLLNQSDLNHVFSSDHLIFNGITKQEVIYGNGLPEDQYQICIRAYDYNTGQPVSSEEPQGCASINITNVEPPIILNPVCGDSITASKPQSIIMSWTMPPGTPMNTQYYLKIVEILPGDRNPNDAMNVAGHPAFFETTLSTTSFLYGPAEPALVEGKNYAFAVTAIDPSSKTSYRNSGMSEVCNFVYKPALLNVTPGLPLSNNNPENNNGNNNNINPPPNANIDFTQLTGDLNCSCKTNAPAGQVDTSDLKQYSKVKVGKFEMTIVSVKISPDGKASGEGKMPIPFLNISQANIRVLFSGVTVTRENGVNIMMTGIVKAKRANDISLSPNVDDPKSGVNPFTLDDAKTLDKYLSTNSSQLISNIQNSSIDFNMPLGIDKEIGGKKIVVALVDFIFTPEQAGFSACMAYSIPEDNTVISLGAKNICFKDASSFCGDLFLYLTNDILISPLNLTLKAISKSDSGTYVSFDKNGFRKLRVRADYEFSQNLIVRQSNKGPVTATLVADVVNWNDWMATINIDPFYLADNQDFGFNLKGVATYDHSDVRNPVGMPTKAIESKINFLDKTWYGFLMPELDITLPEVYKNSKSNSPITVKVENMMIDKLGITGDIQGTNVLNIDDGNLDGWAYSLDSLRILFVNNTYIKGGLKGKILLPITNKNVQSQLDYNCSLTHLNNDPKKPLAFNFVIKPKNTIEVPVFIATFDIDNTSSILVQADTAFRAIATLNGKMDVSTPKNGSVPEMKLLGMKFEELVIQSKPKYFSVKKFSMSLASPQKQASGFPISVDSVQMITDNGIGIRFKLSFTLADIKAMPAASAVLTITGNPVTLDKGKLVFDFTPKLNLEKISIEGDMSVLKVKGFIQFYNGDVTYGDGFKGAIQAVFPSLSVEIDAALQIGFVNNYNYWYVDAMVDFGNTGIPLFPSTAAFGFGGGAYYNMKSQYDTTKTLDVSITKSADVKFGQSPSGVSYVPNKGSMGVKATVIFGLQQRETFNADVTMELGFNTNGGIELFRLSGEGRVISKNKTTAMGRGTVNVQYQFDKQIFDLGVQVTLSIAAVTGSGTLALHAEPVGFYLKIGRAWPEKSRVNINFGPFNANFYFQAGTMDLDPIPPIPLAIQQILEKSEIQINTGFLSKAREGLVSDGSGLIFGGGLNFDADRCFLILCGKLYAGIGFDVSLQKYSTDCNGNENTGSTIGIDGWYAVGQAYAGVQAKLYVDLGITKATIFDAGAGAVLVAKLPNPEYFAGAVGGYYDIGIASGNFSFEFETGTNCRPSGNPLSELKLIADYDPHDKADNVEVNINPQIGTNIEIGKYFTLKEDLGKTDKERSFRFTKDNIAITLKMGNETVPFEKIVSEDGKSLIVFPTEFMKTKTEYVMEITATLDEYTTGWNTALKQDGKPFEEYYLIHFTTGNGIKALSLNDVKYTMPYQGERNFCYAKVAQGLINCWQVPNFAIFDTPYKDDPDLYTTSFLVRFVPTGSSPSTAKITEVPATCSGNNFLFDIPTDLLKESIYTVQFIAQWKSKGASMMMVNKGNGSQGNMGQSSMLIANIGNHLFENKQINQRRLALKPFQQKLFEFSFRTSKFTDYVEKMKTLDMLAGDFNAKGEKDKLTRIVSVGQKELGNPQKLNDLLTGSIMRHGNLVNAYPASFCTYGEEQYDVYDVTDHLIQNSNGKTYTTQPLLVFKTECFENWAKSIYDNLAATIKASGVNALPFNSSNILYSTNYFTAAMPPLTQDEVLTGMNSSVATAPELSCGSSSTDPYIAQVSFVSLSGLSNKTVSVISNSINHSVSFGGYQSFAPSYSYSPQSISFAPDPVAETWNTTKDLTLNVSFSYSSMMNTGGNNNYNVVSSNDVIKSMYGNNLNAGGNKQVAFNSFYQNMGNAYDQVVNIQPAYTKDPCFKTNFNGIQRAGAQGGNESVSILYGK